MIRLVYGVFGGKIGDRLKSAFSRRPKDPADLPPEQRRRLIAGLPAFVSFPRTGSHWLIAVMELYFARPCLREGRSTFLERERIDWMWFHDHDFDLTLAHPDALYIYRDPVDTIYSYLDFRFRASRRVSYWGKFVQRNDHAYSPEKVGLAALEYRMHLKKWLLSPLKARTFVSYDAFVQDNLNEFRKVCQHFGTPMDEARAKQAFASVSKKSLAKVTVKGVALNRQMLTRGYADEREKFREDFAKRIYDLVAIPELEAFIAPLNSCDRAVVGKDRVLIHSAAKYLATDHLHENLKGRMVSGGFVTLFAQGIQFALNLMAIMILARLLLPNDFGLVAMVTTITGFLRIFNDAGLSTATIQREEVTHAQVSNLFWTNIALGGTISLFLAALSPMIAWFYREPRLVGVTLALCVTFLLSSSTAQHLALLKRQMKFKIVGAIEVCSAAAGVLVGIIMAWRHYGYWSLVGAQLTVPSVYCLLTWALSGWRPQLPRRGVGTRSLLTFGANLTASSFLYSLSRGLDGLLIGRFYGAAPLGLYNRAGALLMRPILQFIGPIEAVFVPALSRLQTQPERYRQAVLHVLESVAVASFLFTGLLLGLAHPLTLVMLGDKWEKAAPIFASLTLAALCIPVGSVATWLLTSQGRGRDFLILSLISSALTAVFVVAGLPFGPLGVAMSYSAFSLFVSLPLTYYIGGRRGPVTTGDLWGRFFTHLPLWGIVCAVSFLTRSSMLDRPPWMQLLVGAFAGLLAGTVFICVYPPARRVAQNLIRTLHEFRGQKRKAESSTDKG